MGDYRCADHPVSDKNNVPLNDYVVTDSPPGAPTFPMAVQGSLLPYATDDAQKATAKGKRVEALPAVATLAVKGRPVKLVCEPDSPDSADEFKWGCEKPLGCTIYLPVKSGTKLMKSTLQVGTALGHVGNEKTALGLVALLDAGVFLPMSPGEIGAWSERAQGYKAIKTDTPWVEFEEHEHGYIVRVPRVAECGCEKDLVRRAFWVSKDGRSCQVEEKGIPLATATDPCPED